jgi:uncharacterized protein DUF6166
MNLTPCTYIGERFTATSGATRARVWRFSGQPATLLPLAPSQRIINHSPDGYEWGYGGSGPAQLALALCLDVTLDEERARKVYQEFKFRVVAKLPHERWTLTTPYILEVIEQIESDAETNRALAEINPAHSCVDNPNLPCPACTKAEGGAR